MWEPAPSFPMSWNSMSCTTEPESPSSPESPECGRSAAEAISQTLKRSSAWMIDQIFLSIEDLIDAKMVCGAGGGGFLQVILKKGVQKADVHKRLKDVFQDNPVDVWDCEII